MTKLRFGISMSLDGFVAGPSQSVDDPLGIGGMRLHEWVLPLRAWRAMHGLEGGEVDGIEAALDRARRAAGDRTCRSPAERRRHSSIWRPASSTRW